MNESRDQHEPTQEFTQFLARDVARTLRHHARFAPSPRAMRARKLAVALGSALGTVAVLAIGLVFGTSTGYATARVETERQRDAMAVNAATISTQLTEVRFNLARARADLASSAIGARAGMRATLDAAGAELRRMEASLQRIERDLAQDHADSARTGVTPAPKTMPVKRAIAVTCNALSLCADTTPAQQTIVTVDLPAATARTTLDLWSVHGVREFANGKLLVNDDGGRQLRLYDASLGSSIVVLDTNAYGARRVPLVRFLGDSALLPDFAGRALRVIDANGRVVRSVPLGELAPQLSAPIHVDDKGRVLFSAASWRVAGAADSAPLVRVDLSTKRIDTVARLHGGLELDGYTTALSRYNGNVGWTVAPRAQVANQRYDLSWSWIPGAGTNPIVPDRNDWAVLTDGSIAIVRGHDYHIDWIRPDGRASSGSKLPFDWQALAADSKREMLDSAYLKHFVANAKRSVLRQRLDSARVGDSVTVRLDSLVRTFSFFVRGRKARLEPFANAGGSAAMPDVDGNLWLLPTLPTDSTNRGLVYDVVNARGDLTMRVRLPADRGIAGFGKGGVVYLIAGDRTNGFYIERTKVPGR
jgi:hypothetical protein